MKTIVTLIFVVIWFIHLILGVGAGYAALRLWHSRHHPLIKWVGLYMNAFIIDVLSAILLLFMARGVTLTWKFATVLFVSTLLSDIVRAPLILYLIKGPAKSPLPLPYETSGELPKEFWMNEVRKIVKEELERKEVTSQMTANENKPDRPDSKPDAPEPKQPEPSRPAPTPQPQDEPLPPGTPVGPGKGEGG